MYELSWQWTALQTCSTALLHAQSIILVGHGTGKSSASDVLAAFLAKYHLSLAERIIAIDDVDLPAVTEREIEQLANFYILGPPLKGGSSA